MTFIKMEDGVKVDDNKNVKMGATGNINSARLAALQERKKAIEDKLAQRNQELTLLCIQEYELTGIIPSEMPLEPGKQHTLRRRVGTSYQLPENLVNNANNNKEESITDLELQIQLHANLAEAALGLANEQNMSKTVRRQHRTEYQKHKKQYTMLQERLALLKEKAAAEQQHKQQKKKQPRVPETQEDNISLNTNMNEPFSKTILRQSLRSVKYSMLNEGCVEDNNSPIMNKNLYRNTDSMFQDPNLQRRDESFGFYRLSINGYANYIERQENMNINNIHMYNSNSPQNSPYLVHNPHMQMNINQHMQHHIQHYQQQLPSPQMQYSPRLPQRPTTQIYNYPPSYQLQQEGNKYNTMSSSQSNPQLHRQSSGHSIGSSLQKMQYYQQHSPQLQPAVNYRQSHQSVDSMYRNPHQLQPHQQYEHNTMTSGSGLGGCWKKSETGEIVWCSNSSSSSSTTIDPNWQRDKRFGSLDRRKNKRIQKRTSPSSMEKSATITPNYSTSVKTTAQIPSRRLQDNRQLVRTQSLGSVGAQTIDNVWPSDDNSSIDSDNRSINDSHGVRKPKEKEWLETSLDGPISPTHSIVSRSQSALPTILAPEEKYVVPQPPQIPSPIKIKPPLEIPAESNPSPRLPETNLELFNNNIPKNCTVVQAGQCKPYHEETKPFEMSDFYKYSTKYKKSNESPTKQNMVPTVPENVVDDPRNSPKVGYQQPPQVLPPKYMTYSNSTINANGPPEIESPLNTSIDLSQIDVANHFSAEMNAWFKNHEHQTDNSNNSSGTTSKSRSTATLV